MTGDITPTIKVIYNPMMKTMKGKYIGAYFQPEEHSAFTAEAKAAGRSLRAHLHWKTREALMQAGLLPKPPARRSAPKKRTSKKSTASTSTADTHTHAQP